MGGQERTGGRQEKARKQKPSETARGKEGQYRELTEGSPQGGREAETQATEGER